MVGWFRTAPWATVLGAAIASASFCAACSSKKGGSELGHREFAGNGGMPGEESKSSAGGASEQPGAADRHRAGATGSSGAPNAPPAAAGAAGGADASTDTMAQAGAAADAGASTGVRVVALRAAFHTCALFDSGSVKCWGRNPSGELGLGDTDDRGDEPDEMGEALPPVDLGTGRTAVAIAVGEIHSCAILDNHEAKCWGGNWAGELGIGERGDRGDEPDEMADALPTADLGPGRTVLAIASGGRHTCAILDDESVKCWGYNHTGQLGLGDVLSRGDGVRTEGSDVVESDMGDALPTVDLGTGRTVLDISVGADHTCAILDDQSVKCWGGNDVGQLGVGTTNYFGDEGRWQDEMDEMGDYLPTVDLGPSRAPLALSTGTKHSCALFDDNTVKCWGGNSSGQLGLGDSDNRGFDPDEMGDALPAVDLGTGRTALAVSAGGSHTCALLDDHSVKCWGGNEYGQLGLGDTDSRGDDPGEMGDHLPAVQLGSGRTVQAITAGWRHTCALLDDNSIKCWGEGASGNLGLGDTENRGDSSSQMGDALPAVRLFAR
ncbi:MAG: hypothetical protein JW940_16135 [Polyangiaceae bacterium]|nr:hypothetical protein [Polyangiaceae bacterium]